MRDERRHDIPPQCSSAHLYLSTTSHSLTRGTGIRRHTYLPTYCTLPTYLPTYLLYLTYLPTYFQDLTRGTGIIFFDDFCQWAVTASLEFDEPELEPEPQNDYAAAAAEAAAELSRKMKREAELLKAKRDAAQKSFNTRVEAAVVARHTHTSAADLIGQVSK